MRRGLVLFALFIGLGLGPRPVSAEPLEQHLAHGECVDAWRAKGFSAAADDPKLRSLFDPHGRETYSAFYKRVERKKCWKEWTIAIYMAGDNNLSAFSFRDIWEMEAAGSFPSVDVVVFHVNAQTKGAKYYHVAKNHDQADYRGELDDFIRRNQIEARDDRAKETAFLEAEGPKLIKSPIVKTIKQADAADNKSLDDFLSWAWSEYPSRRTVFIAWGHGVGFDAKPESIEGAAPAPTPAGGNKGNVMAVTEMTKVIKTRLQNDRQGHAIDIAGSDSCLNQQVEYGYEWKGLADYVFGSSTIVQFKGFNYRTLLNWFGQHPSFETDRNAAQIPALYGGSVSSGSGRKYSSYYDPYATMGVWTMGEMDLLKNAIDALGQDLFDWLSSGNEVERLRKGSDLKKKLKEALRLGGISNDLYNSLLILSMWARDLHEPNIQRRANEVIDALNRTVLAKYIGAKYKQSLTLTSKGVAIWLPETDKEFEKKYPLFQRSRFYRDARGKLAPWGKLVGRLYGEEED